MSSLSIQIDRDTVTFANSIHPMVRGEKEFSSASEAREWLSDPENSATLQRVTVLDLHGKSIQHLPPEIRFFPRLKSLHIHNNNLQTLPREISTLRELEYLHASENPLEALPDELGSLSLRKIDLRNTHFENYPAALRALLGRCKVVTDEGFPRISDIETFANSIPLKVRDGKVFFSASEARGWLSDPKNSATLRRVTVLDLNGKSIQHLPPEIRFFPRLKSLHIHNNNLQTLPREISTLSELEYLHASDNPLKALPSELSQLPLRKIDLRNTHFENFPAILGALNDCEIVTDGSFPAARGPLMAAVAAFFKR